MLMRYEYKINRFSASFHESVPTHLQRQKMINFCYNQTAGNKKCAWIRSFTNSFAAFSF